MLATLLAQLKIEQSSRASLGTLLGDSRPRHLLGIAGVPRTLRAALDASGCLVGTVPGVGGALFALRKREFDGVVVRPDAENGLGLKLIRALKLDGEFPGLSEQFVEPVRRMVRSTPFWIAPFPGEDEYGVVLSRSCIELRREVELPMAEAICRLKSFVRDTPAEA